MSGRAKRFRRLLRRHLKKAQARRDRALVMSTLRQMPPDLLIVPPVLEQVACLLVAESKLAMVHRTPRPTSSPWYLWMAG